MVPAITAVIVNYNSGDCLAGCVQSLKRSDTAATVIVVDNASQDRSLAVIRPDNTVRVIENDHNPGFAYACNQALGLVDTPYVLFINPDCEVDSPTLSRLRNALQDHAGAVMAGAWVVDREGQVQRATQRTLPNPANSFREIVFGSRAGDKGVDWSHRPKPERVTEVDAVSGACMMLDTAWLKQAGGLDAAYRLHCEDLDLMYRIKQSGKKTVLVPNAEVLHLQGVSSARRPLWVSYQKHRGMWRYYRKYHARWPTAGLVWSGIWSHFLLHLPALLFRAVAKR